MADQDIENGLAELRRFMDQRHGRGVRVAKLLEVSPQLLTGWYAGRSVPKLKTWMALQDFLKKSDRGRRAAIGEE